VSAIGTANPSVCRLSSVTHVYCD